MSLTRISLCCVVLLAWASYAPVHSQDAAPPGTASLGEPSPYVEAPQAVPEEDFYYPDVGASGGAPRPSYRGYNPIDVLGSRFSYRSDIGNGPGWAQGFQNFNLFVPITLQTDTSILFADARAIATNNGAFGGNVGFGGRFFSERLQRVTGASVWYDYDDSNDTNYDQLGISLESLGTDFDVRFNAYFPSNDNQRTVTSHLNGKLFFFQQFIGIGNTRVAENALRGGDFEIGGATPLLGDFGIRNYIGGYYFQAPSVESTVGFKIRSEVLVTEDIQLQIGASTDSLFGQNVYGAVSFYLPDGSPRRVLSRQPVRERLYSNVERNYRLNVYRRTLDETIKAINPITGLPYIVSHVDNNTVPGNGDGTVKNPFGRLSDAPPGADIVFVNHNKLDGNGQPVLTGYDTGITLLDNQRLLGQGIAHQFIDLKYGVLTLPGNDNGPIPTITNPAGDVVTLANNNEVSGFNIGAAAPNAPGGNGIFGTGINNFDINRNVISNAGLSGISLTNASGNGSITDNVINSSTLENINISNVGTAPLILNVQNNQSQVGLAGLVLRGDASDITATIQDNVFSNQTNNGIELLAANTGTSNLTVVNNVTNSNGGNGIQGTADNGTLNLALSNNTSNLNIGSGLSLGTSNNGTLNVNATDNSLSSNTGNGLNILADSGTVTLTNFSFTDMNSNGGIGAVLNADNGGAINGTFASNSLQSNVGGGLSSTLNNGSQSAILFDQNVVIDNAGFGMSFSALNGSVINHTLTNNQVRQVAGNVAAVGAVVPGILLNGQSGSQVTFLMNNNQVTGIPTKVNPATTADQGIGLDASITNSLSNITLTNNLFSDNQDAGIRLSYSGTTNATQLIDGNTIQNTIDNPATASPLGQGLVVELHGVGGAPTVSSTIQNNTIQNNASDGIFMSLVDGTGLMPLNTVNNNNLLVNRRDGLSMQLGGNSIAVLNASNNLITTQGTVAGAAVNGVNGVNLSVTADALLTANLTQNVIDGSSTGTTFSTGNGVLMNIFQDGTLNATLTQNQIRQNGVDGVHVGPDPLTSPGNPSIHGSQETSHINVSLQSNLIEQNRDDGVQISVAQVSVGAPAFTGNGNFVLNGNTIRNNGLVVAGVRTGAGVNAEVRSGRMDLVMTNNSITDNASDGVLLRNSMGFAVDSSSNIGVATGNGDTNVYSILNATLDGNTLSNNGNRGLNLRFDDITPLAAIQGFGARGNVSLTNNTIDGNNDEGVLVLMNTVHDDNNNPGGWSFSQANENLFNGNAAYANNLAQLTFTAVDNTITNNGGGNGPDTQGAVAGDGMFILVGTGSLVNADIRNNTFGGNFADDFHTDSYVAGPNTPATAYDTPADGTTRTFRDRLANLNLRFTGNVGQSIGAVTDSSLSSRLVNGVVHPGFYTNLDAQQTAPQVTQRLAPFIRTRTLFQVEDTPTAVGSVLNGTNSFSDPDSTFPRNNFINGGYVIAPIGSLFP